MRAKYFVLLAGLCIVAAGGCQGKDAVKKSRELSPERDGLYQELARTFTQGNFERLVDSGTARFYLLLVNSPREPVDGVWKGGTGNLIYNSRHGGRGFTVELSTSMFPVLSSTITFTPEGVMVRYWSQDFISSNERLTQEEIDKYTVYRLYEGVLPKEQFLRVLKDELLFVFKLDDKSVAEDNFYVMRVVKEQKERPKRLE